RTRGTAPACRCPPGPCRRPGPRPPACSARAGGEASRWWAPSAADAPGAPTVAGVSPAGTGRPSPGRRLVGPARVSPHASSSSCPGPVGTGVSGGPGRALRATRLLLALAQLVLLALVAVVLLPGVVRSVAVPSVGA